MGVAVLQIEIGLNERAASAGLVHHVDGCFHEVLLLHDLLYGSGCSIDAAARRDADEHFDRLAWSPGRGLGKTADRRNRETQNERWSAKHTKRHYSILQEIGAKIYLVPSTST